MQRSKFAFLALINALAVFTLDASTLTWTGSNGNNLMDTPSNWIPSQAPANGDSLIFPSGLTPTITNNVPPPLVLGSSLSILDAYKINGGTFAIPAGGTTLTYGTNRSTVNTAITLNGPLLINSNSSGNILGGQITGTGAPTILGSIIFSNGSVIAPNNYSGTTSVGNSSGASGTLTAGASGSFSSSSNIVLYSGSTLSLVNAGASFNCTIGTLTQGIGAAGNGSVVLGSGVLTLVNSGANTFPGIISATSGGLTVNGSGSLTLTGSNVTFSSQTSQAAITVGSGATLVSGSPNALGSVAAGSYANATVQGTLNLSGNDFLANSLNGSGSVNLAGALLTVAGGGTFSGVISGTTTASALTITGGTFTSSNANTFQGPTTLASGGTLVIQNANALQNSSALNFTTGIATLQIGTTGFSFGNTVTLSSPASAVISLGSNNATIAGAITGAGTFTVQGTGTLTLNGANNYTGKTTINGTTLLAGSTSAFGTGGSPVLITNSGTLNLNGRNNSIQSLAGGYNSNVYLSTNSAGGTLTITGGSVDDAFYGVIANNGTQAGNVAVTGGTVTLMEPNTYTGTTTLSGAATLNTYSLGTTSALTFSGSGGTVSFGSSSTSTAALTLGSNSVLTPNTYNIGLSGNIGGSSGTLFILGPGKVTLSGTLAPSAATSFQIQGSTLNVIQSSLVPASGTPPAISINAIGGTLQAGGNLTIPSNQPITLAGVPGAIDLNSYAVSIASPISGSGNLIVTDSVGGGTLTLTNSGNAYEGSTSIYNGTLNAVAAAIPNHATTSPTPAQLIFGGLGAPVSATPIFQCGGAFAAFTPAIVFMSSGTIDTNGNNMVTSGVVAGGLANTFTKAGSGILTLGGANIYKGPTIVSAGTLQAGVASTSTSGAFGYNSAVTVSSGATLALNNFSNTVGSLSGAGNVTLGTGTLTVNNGNSLSFSGNITGSSGGVTLTQGTLTLSGNNAYSGTTMLSGGTLIAGSTTALANSSTFAISNGATLNLNGNSSTIVSLFGSIGGAVTLGSATLTLSNGSSSTFAGNITGTTGALTLTSGTQILSGTNSYQGATTINGGTLQAGASNTFASQSAVTVASGATLSLNGFNNTIKSLTGVSGSSVNLGSGVLTIANGNTQTFSGGISGIGGGITLSSGQLTLGAANSYTGPTLVNTGTLIASNSNTAPFGVGSNLTVQNGGTVNFGTINSSGVTVGALQNSANVIANMTAGRLNVASYTQISNGALSLTLPTTPLTSFQAISSTGTINLAGALTVSGLSTSTAPVVLIKGTGAANQLSGTFSTTTLPSGFSLKYDYAENLVYLTGGTGGCNGTWIHSSSANWGDTVNWDNGCAPGVSNTPGNLDTATFGNLSPSSISIYLATSGGSGPTVQNVTLYDMDFTASSTSYNILSYFGSTITLDGVASPKPRITVNAGSHTLYPPVILNKDSRLSLSGTLTMGLFSSIASSGSTPNSTLYISENDTAGIFNNYGAITPGNVNIQGCTTNNYSTISPIGVLTIQAITGNASSLIVNNYDSMLPASLVINGSASSTIVNNIGSGQVISPIGQISTTTGGIAITAANVSNTLGGQIYAANGQTLTINSGTVSNDASSIIGSTESNITLAGGTLSTSGKVLADNYTQSSGSTLQINVLDVANSGNLAISGTANLGGTLAVNALSGFTLSSTDIISLITDANGFASQFGNYQLQNFPSSVIPEILVTPTSIELVTTPVTVSHISASASPQLVFNAITMHNSFITRNCYQLKGRMPKAGKKEKVAIRKTAQGDVVYLEQPPMFELAERLPLTPDSQGFEYASSSSSDLYEPALWNILPHWSLPNNTEATIPTELQKEAQLSRKIEEESEKTFNVYMGPTSSFGSNKTVGSQVGLGYSTVGALAGFDAILGIPSEGYVSGGIGSIVSYEKLWGKAADHRGSMSLDKVHASVYGLILPSKLPELYFEMIAGCAYSWDSLNRDAGYDGSLQAKGHTNELIFDGLAGVEYTVTNKAIPFFGKSFSMTPLLHLQYAHDHVYGFKERGAGIYNLKIDAQNVQALMSSLGARFDYLFSYSKFNMTIELDAEWQREYLNRNRSAYFTPFNITNISSPTIINAGARNSGLVALDVFSNFSKGWQLEANGTFQWNHLAYNAFFYLGFGKAF